MRNIPLILGLGKTGFSVASYFKRKKIDFRVIDTRANPPHLTFFRKAFPNIPIHLGYFKLEWFQDASQIIVSPGLDWNEIINQTGCSLSALRSDIDLFNEQAQAPILAITGSNGKSTTTALLASLLTKAHQKVYIGGNFGIPLLDLLEQPTPDFYILELSSFQLTFTQHVKVYIAIFLNLYENHIDRHGTLAHYRAMKQKIYEDCKIAIYNRDHPDTMPIYPVSTKISFGSAMPSFQDQWGLIQEQKTTWLAQGNQKLLDIKSLSLPGQFNALNALAALAAGQILKLPLNAMLSACTQFQGLPHRCEKIMQYNHITWINDSKSTNVNATIAAIESLLPQHSAKLILILGGINKNKNIHLLIPFVQRYVKRVILIGQDAKQFKQILQGAVSISQAENLKQTVQIASNYAKANDIVLLSPACASFDMFKDYVERGENFKKEVYALFHENNI